MTADAIARLLQPYVAGAPAEVEWPRIHSQLAAYLDLLLKWNARTNLTAIRTPEEMVRRHFGESLFAATLLGNCHSLLDFGSGGGFPGIPMQLLRPEMAVTLAESQGKKAAFLRDAVRELGLKTEVWAQRVEAMPPERRFHTVAMRAVDRMSEAVEVAAERAESRMMLLTTAGWELPASVAREFEVEERVKLPESQDGVVLVAMRR